MVGSDFLAGNIDFSRIIEWFCTLSILQWAILAISSVSFLWFVGNFFVKRLSKGRNFVCAVASIVYAYVAFLITNNVPIVNAIPTGNNT